ncbi:murein biosynthesis integral membrane protein MurJ [Novosphingobium sp.]|uniref:murein biosynthesis integral membrane protein MurJ n=1 Tax=Novosphingobium sp. TaxID=1874826 RepID=UPI0025D42F5D|nr:murein biosynthesis integral membrane protein MurJ [Novosphingobium sp.]MCC6924437.1 murein biosynthesis integral membrane protein MurJ [Novosphingobium sp.]
MSLVRHVGTIGGLTMVSRLFGFARDMLLSRILGAGLAGDAWQLAFQIPNIFRRLFAEGAFSAAFVPLFNRRMNGPGDEADDRESAERFAVEVLSVLVPVLIGFSALAMLAMPWLIWLIDDFGQGGRGGPFTVGLARVTFPYLIFISVMTVFAAILNSVSRFAAAAAAPVLLNLCLIAALLYVQFSDGGADPQRTAWLVGIAASTSGFLQMTWLWFWARKAGFRFPLHRPRLTPEVRELGVLIVPAVFGAGIYQLSRFLDLFFLGRLPEGAFVYLAMADRLNQLPLGIIGIALGTAILPSLSRFIARNDAGGAQRVQSNAIELGMLLTIPAAVGLFFAAQPLTAAIYLGGKFDAQDVTATASTVAMLVVGLPAFVLVKILTPGFFARRDTRTPVVTAAISLAINLALNLFLIPRMGVAGLALASGLAGWCNCAMLYGLLHQRGHFQIESDLGLRIARIALAAAVMGGVIHFLAPLGNGWYQGGVLARIVSVGALVGTGAVVFFVIAWISGAIDRSKIDLLSRRSSSQE